MNLSHAPARVGQRMSPEPFAPCAQPSIDGSNIGSKVMELCIALTIDALVMVGMQHATATLCRVPPKIG
jgi:hypothetical protein